MNEELEEYSNGDGPICPSCKRQYVADEGFYYNDRGFEMECDQCRKTFWVQPYTTTTWTTTMPKPTSDSVTPQAITDPNKV
jgi:transposase-like protein